MKDQNPDTDRTITLRRRIPAPPGAVWAAWTDPERLPLWWGPRGFSCETKEIDLREGGQWRFDMIAPDGTRFVNRHRFVRLVPETRIDYLLDDDGTGSHHFAASVRFAPAGTGTDLTFSMTFDTVAEKDEVEGFGAVAFGYTTLDCLAEAAMAGNGLSITRLLPATPERVWTLWTDPEELSRWFFPDDIEIVSTDFRPRDKGRWRTLMRGRDSGEEFRVRGTFEVIDPPRELAFTHGWEDDAGDVATMTRVTVTLAPEGPGTRLTLLQEGLASAASRDGHFDGWSQTLDNLERRGLG